MYGYVQVIPVNQNLRLQTAPRAQFPTIDFLLLALNTVKKKSWIWSSLMLWLWKNSPIHVLLKISNSEGQSVES